jgi:hypothetical protein
MILNKFAVIPFVLLISLNSQIAYWTNELIGAGMLHITYYPRAVISSRFVTRFLASDYWLSIWWSSGVAFAIYLLLPLVVPALQFLHVNATRFWSFLMADNQTHCSSHEVSLAPSRLSWVQLVETSTTSTTLVEYLRFLTTNTVVSMLLLLLLFVAGVPIIGQYSATGVERAVPAYIGYLAISQLVVNGLFLIRLHGDIACYQAWLKFLAGSISVSLLVSALKTTLSVPQLVMFLQLIPSIYFRNGLATSFFCISLLGAASEDAKLLRYGNKAIALRNLSLLLILGWPFPILPFGLDLSFPFDHLATLTLDYLYPFASAVVFFVVVIAWLGRTKLSRINPARALQVSFFLAIAYVLSIYAPRVGFRLQNILAGNWIAFVPLLLGLVSGLAHEKGYTNIFVVLFSSSLFLSNIGGLGWEPFILSLTGILLAKKAELHLQGRFSRLAFRQLFTARPGMSVTHLVFGSILARAGFHTPFKNTT